MNGDTALRNYIARQLEQVQTMRGRPDHSDELAHARQEGEMNAFQMAIAVVRNDPEDPMLHQIDRMMTQAGLHEPGVVIPDGPKIRYLPPSPPPRSGT